MLITAPTDPQDWQLLLQQLPIALMVFEGDDLILKLINDPATELVGSYRDEIMDKPIDEIFPQHDDQKINCLKALRTRSPHIEYEVEFDHFVHGKKSTRYMDQTFLPLQDGDKKIKGVIVMAVDVTEKVQARKKTEEENKILQETLTGLIKTKERYQHYMSQSTEGIWRIELDEPVNISLPADEQIDHMFRYAYLAECNDAMAKMYGYGSASDLTGKRLDEFLPKNEDSFAYLRYFIKSGYRLEGTESIERDKDGNTKYFINNLVGSLEGNFVVRAWGSQTDITIQKLAEEKIRQSEQQQRVLNEQLEMIVKDRTAELGQLNKMLLIQNETFKQAEESSGQGSYSFNLTTGVLSYSDNLYRLLGFEPGEFEPSLEEFNHHVHPDDRDYVAKAAEQVLATLQPNNWRYRMITKNGDTIQILGTGRIISYNRETLLVGTLQDITKIIASEELLKEKNMELQHIIDQLHQRELKDEQKDNFIAMASHELKTPITSIKGYVQFLMKEFGSSNGKENNLPPLLLRSSLINVDKQINRLTRLISELLDLTKIETGTLELKKEKFSLNELAIEMVQDILYLNSHRAIDLAHEYKAYVFADKGRLGQAMSNLLSNAVKYSPDNSKIQVTIHMYDGKPAFTVKDDGIGIHEEDQKKIFERFYRAKERTVHTYPGFGIGLFIVKEFVERHGGKVIVQSEEGNGSTFTFTIPAA
jgi:PAS domain S-box-containing protein